MYMKKYVLVILILAIFPYVLSAIWLSGYTRGIVHGSEATTVALASYAVSLNRTFDELEPESDEKISILRDMISPSLEGAITSNNSLNADAFPARGKSIMKILGYGTDSYDTIANQCQVELNRITKKE
jgi:hypothetical protein